MNNKSSYFTQGLVALSSEEKGKKLGFKFHWNCLFQETLGSLAIFFAHFHNNMRVEDKRLFCYLVAIKAASGEDISPILTMMQVKDEFSFHLIRLLLVTPIPEVPRHSFVRHPTPLNANHTPPMGSIVPPMPLNRYPTTIPGMPIPLEEEGLDESDPNMKPIIIESKGQKAG